MPSEIADPLDVEAALEVAALPDDGRQEPALLRAPRLVGFDDTQPLDPARAEDIPVEPPPPQSRAVAPHGPLVSFAVHCIVLALLLVTWSRSPLELPKPIPVSLVIEHPAPAQRPSAAHRRGPLASVDLGSTRPAERTAPDGAPAAAQPKAAVPPPPPPKPTPPRQVAVLVPPPPPPKPTPPPDRLEVKPENIDPPQSRFEVPAQPARRAKYAGPAATRSEYLAYLVTLTRQHLDLLPLSLVGDRRGETHVGVLVRDDGTIAKVQVIVSSGYPDIDRRVEQMVLAVGRFPPLPQWFQGTSMELVLKLRFPDALRR